MGDYSMYDPAQEVAKLNAAEAQVRALREENARLREERDGLPMAERLRRAEIVAGVTGTYREQLTCIDVWLNRREPVKYESATLRHVQEEVERLTRERDDARTKLAQCVEALEQIDRETRSASDVAALRYGSIARVVLAAAKGGE